MPPPALAWYGAQRIDPVRQLVAAQILRVNRLPHPLLANEGPISLLGRLRHDLRVRRMSPRTEEAYVRWVKRYVRFHGRAHPRDLGAGHVTAFLTQLAVGERVGASSQNQALGALLFLYRHVLDQPIPWIHDVVRARRVHHLPAVLSRAEVQEVLVELSGSARLVALLLYGSGLRLMEALTLRVKDLMLERGTVTVRQGKGGKDRVTVLPRSSIAPLRAHLAAVHGRFVRDKREGVSVPLPGGLARKLSTAGETFAWCWVFPATRTYVERTTGLRRRHHLHPTAVQRAVARPRAVRGFRIA